MQGILLSSIILCFATSASARFMGDSSLHSGVIAVTAGDANGDTQVKEKLHKKAQRKMIEEETTLPISLPRL